MEPIGASSQYNDYNNKGRRQRVIDPTFDTRNTRQELFSNIDQTSRNPDSFTMQLDEEAFMNRSENAIDDFILQGQASLLNLKEQRHMLKSAKTRALNTAHTLGISTNLIGFIERRSKQDWYLFFGLAVCTIILFIWLFFG